MKKSNSLLFSVIFVCGASNVSAQGFSEQAKLLGFERMTINTSTNLSNLDGIDKATLFNSRFIIDTTYSLSGDLKFNFKGGIKFETGSTSSSFNEKRYSPKSGVTYNHAFVSYSPYRFINVNIGSLNNNNEAAVSKFLTYGTTFLGAREEISFKTSSFKASFIATQAKPYNDQLSERIGITTQSAPKFFNEILNLNFIIRNIDLKLQAGSFAYSALSSSTAFYDQFYGNSASGSSETLASYDYTFKGTTYGGSAGIRFKSGFSFTPSFSVVKNNSAPKGKNTGKYIALSFKGKIFNYTTELKVTNFENQTDTAPSFYNKSNFRNGYKGQMLQLITKNPNRLQTVIKYIDRKLINSSNYLSNEKVIGISLRKSYDIF